MEDDIEVELELEKQLALARELFPTERQTSGGWPWSSSQQQSAEDNVIRANV